MGFVVLWGEKKRVGRASQRTYLTSGLTLFLRNQIKRKVKFFF